MKRIIIPENDLWDEKKNEFIEIKKTEIMIEHSLVSISKWEQRWHKPFLDRKEKTIEESLDYIRCMTITQNVNPYVYYGITDDVLKEVDEYMNDPMTATWFSNDDDRKTSNDILTSEIIYYQMASYGIPVEFQKWHLNRLITLIMVFSEKNKPPKKMSKKQILSKYASINAARRAKLNTTG